MTWWQPDKFKEKTPNLLLRAKMVQDIRKFLIDREYLEVETSALQTSPGMETHVKAFETELFSADRQSKTRKFLHTSPELAMKKLLVAGLPKIFQICQVFRNAEGSSTHTPSFTMLEWYNTGFNYHELMDETIELIMAVSKQEIKWNGLTSNPHDKWQKITACEAFKKYADLNLEELLASGEKWEDLFFDVFLEKIEPCLGHPVPTILYDYPIEMAALARAKPENPRFAERFEVYICGLELANAFGELTDASVQELRFKNAMQKKKQIYNEDYPMDKDFIKALEYGMPEASGIALGIDRLAMLLCNTKNIRTVQAF